MTGAGYGDEPMNDHVLAMRRPGPVDPGRLMHGRHTVARRASLVLVAAGVLAQIAYPLLSGEALRAATILSVLLLAAASIVHAGATWGWRGALIVPAVAGGLGLAAETIGVHTGFPFGSYTYADTLGPRVAAVPLIVPLAWTMLAYPCLLLGRRLARHARHLPRGFVQDHGVSLIGGVCLAGWDLFLDPQMVAQGHWSWAHPTPALPGVPGVPLTNYAGWLLVSVLMIAVLNHLTRDLPPRSPIAPTNAALNPPEVGRTGDYGGAVFPAAVLAWTWWGSAVGNLMFFDRPWVALYGGLVMGSVVVPYLLLLISDALSDAAKTRPALNPRNTQVSPNRRPKDKT